MYNIDENRNLSLKIKNVNYNHNKNIKKHNCPKHYNEELLRIFINIFYYEVYLSENKEKVFDNNEQYYIINPKWLQSYKKYYNYDELSNFLKVYNRNNEINYKNLEQYYEKIINEIINKNIINLKEKELSKNLLNLNQINCNTINKHYIHFIHEGIIFPSKIMEKIKQFHKNISKGLMPKELYFKNKNIFYINKFNKKIIIGNLNENNKFIPKNIFIFNSIDKLEIKKNNIISDSFSINKYLLESMPIEGEEYFRIFKNENNEEIYKLIIIDNNKNNQKNNNKQKNNNGKSQKNNNNSYINKLAQINGKSSNSINNDNIQNLSWVINREAQISYINININENYLNKLEEIKNEIKKLEIELNKKK